MLRATYPIRGLRPRSPSSRHVTRLAAPRGSILSSPLTEAPPSTSTSYRTNVGAALLVIVTEPVPKFGSPQPLDAPTPVGGSLNSDSISPQLVHVSHRLRSFR
ncbi:uncharacterized protein METZ01_LOCUS17430 [marine metagenome]|uniref:Uncharacterized protein n=1 Tax=marine metagenome TaxID=408172 RepID=A0A381PC72_9ZZZZ